MIKGKTIIELTNVKTGEVERHEDTNLVTNALNNIFKPIGVFTRASLIHTFSTDDLVPYYQTLTGGVLLFDKTIDENVDTMYAPLEAKLVGCGAYGLQNGTTGTCRGNFNQDESEANLDSGTIKYVYDFPTSKGNGTINCVCLTSKNGGGCSYGSKDAERSGFPTMCFNLTGTTVVSKFPWSNNKETPFMIDIDEDVIYTLRVNSVKSLSILKRHAFFKSISLFDDPVNEGGKVVETKALTELTTGLYSTTIHSCNVDLNTMKLYITSGQSSSLDTTNKGMRVITVDLNSFEVTENSTSNNTGITLKSNDRNIVYNGYIYLRQIASPYAYYKISISSGSDYTKITPSKIVEDSWASYVMNGRIYLDGYDTSYSDKDNRCAVIDTETNTMYDMENRTIFYIASTVIPVKGRPWLFYILSGYYGSNAETMFVIPANYLATINNLSEPVIKTSEQTMKLTYILQRADE